jgi:hypothetical protein
MVNYMNQVNLAGIDEITANNRTRASAAAGTNAQGTMWMQGTGVATSSASTVGITLTAAMLGGGFIIHNPGTTAVTDTTDTAANILAYMNANSAGVNVGDILQVESFTNAGTTTGVITIAGGTGVTLDANGTGTVPVGVQKTLNFRCTNTSTPTFTLYM